MGLGCWAIAQEVWERHVLNLCYEVLKPMRKSLSNDLELVGDFNQFRLCSLVYGIPSLLLSLIRQPRKLHNHRLRLL